MEKANLKKYIEIKRAEVKLQRLRIDKGTHLGPSLSFTDGQLNILRELETYFCK